MFVLVKVARYRLMVIFLYLTPILLTIILTRNVTYSEISVAIMNILVGLTLNFFKKFINIDNKNFNTSIMLILTGIGYMYLIAI